MLTVLLALLCLPSVSGRATCESSTSFANAVKYGTAAELYGLVDQVPITWEMETLLSGDKLIGSNLSASVFFFGQIDDLHIDDQKFELCNQTSTPCHLAVPGTKLELTIELNVPALRGLYAVEIRATSADGSDTELFCVASEFKQARVYAYVWAVLTFSLAATASWELGSFFPLIKLPLITGYLFIGIIMGPFVTGMIDRFNIDLLVEFINQFALAFISFAAGAEIYFPSFVGESKQIFVQMSLVLLFTLVLTVLPIWAMGQSGTVGFMSEEQVDGACQAGQALLLGAIMVARSPASAIAILKDPSIEIKEGGRAQRFSRTMIGVTVLSDVAVVFAFSIANTLAAALCNGLAGVDGEASEPLTVGSVAVIVGQLLGALACGQV